MSVITKPDIERELSRLKDFQRDTVEHVFDRMYRSAQPAKRFLVADEVGLGKTLVARGLVAKVVERLWDTVDRIDIIYICSNGSIARQNINRLNVSEAKDASLPSRITLLPTVVRGLKDRKLNFISLTPQTSFDLRSSLGTYEERALLYWLLPEEWKASEIAVQNLLQGGAERDGFRRRVKEFSREHIDPELKTAFHEQLAKHADIKQLFADVADRFATWRLKLPDEDRLAQRKVVGTLRLELAVSCLEALQPDLIILDEFQRFKHLLDGTDQTGDLAQELFTFGDARVLLLSATPYKMYTLSDESQTDDHFRDFLQTVRFLHDDEPKTNAFKKRLGDYRDAVFALGSQPGATERLTTSKDAVEADLREVMVRTERLSASVDRNGMLAEIPAAGLHLRADDVSTYLAYARIAHALEHSDIAEYWKSAPFLLNFMDEYQFKSEFDEAATDRKRGSAMREAVFAAPRSVLNWDDVERYKPLDPANARLRQLLSDITAEGAWELLWLPPALSYYQLDDAFESRGDHKAKKRLVFSSWQVVPKVVASILSYEAERRMFGERTDIERPNTAPERERLAQLLRFSRDEGRLTGLPVFSLLYPSITLAALGDPLQIAREHPGRRLSAAEVLGVITERIRAVLGELPQPAEPTAKPDETWYWLAPALCDLARYPDDARRWLQQSDLAAVWRGEQDEPVDADQPAALDAWEAHVAEFVRAAFGQIRLGPQPADLAEVLANAALAAPAVVTLRALSRICGGADALRTPAIRNNAGWVAWGFRTLFNLPEVTAMIRRRNSAEPYWQRVLEYGVVGGLQAVMDEYIHVLQDWEGVGHRSKQQASRAVAVRAVQALQLRTALVGVDSIEVGADRLTISDHRMRARFAARFGARQTDEGAGAVRADDVRSAFNAPFWPFVLCSTSVGQEGLDFHLYCHAVVHWNLPSNPVDLEQREGRVHRYKGHAIRKNAAQLYGQPAVDSTAVDPWDKVFELATQDRDSDASDLTPYWLLPAENGARIERHVPSLPLSRDIERAEALRRTLTVYRMAFGQNRQDDIVAYLTSRFPAEEIQRLAERLRINLAPAPGKREKSAPVTWARAGDTEDFTEVTHTGGRGTITIAAAESLLNEFAQRRAASARAGVDQYRELLDRFVALKD